jgi:SAM-dependent methyltransferase
MSEKDDPQAAPVNTGEAGKEHERLRRTYRRYRQSRRKRKAWAADNPGNIAIRAELRKRLLSIARGELAGEGEILDLGCGGGWWLAELAGAGVVPSRLHGVDLLEERVARAREAVAGADVRIADAATLPFEDEQFTLVLAFTLLSSLPVRESVRAVVSEAERVLAPGGLMLCYEPRVPNPFNRATRRIAISDLRPVSEGRASVTRLTVLPALARRLGRRTPQIYPRLAGVPPLLTHHLVACRKSRDTREA